MKAILLAAAAVVALAFGSCSKADKEAKSESNDFKAKIENCTNPDSIATYVQQAEAYARKLVDEGNVEEAKKYLADIQPIVKKKAPAHVGVFETVRTAENQRSSGNRQGQSKQSTRQISLPTNTKTYNH